MKCPEQANLQRQKVDHWLPEGWDVTGNMRSESEVSFRVMKMF